MYYGDVVSTNIAIFSHFVFDTFAVVCIYKYHICVNYIFDGGCCERDVLKVGIDKLE